MVAHTLLDLLAILGGKSVVPLPLFNKPLRRMM